MQIESDERKNAFVLAHETAHSWCEGADAGSWEDWLNETTANWSALLFALRKNDSDLFDFILNPMIEKYDGLPRIKTSDNSRPDGVREKRTVLFYRIYQRYGCDTISKMLRCFVELEPEKKNTESFLTKLRHIGLSNAADMIENNL